MKNNYINFNIPSMISQSNIPHVISNTCMPISWSQVSLTLTYVSIKSKKFISKPIYLAHVIIPWPVLIIFSRSNVTLSLYIRKKRKNEMKATGTLPLIPANTFAYDRLRPRVRQNFMYDARFFMGNQQLRGLLSVSSSKLEI